MEKIPYRTENSLAEDLIEYSENLILEVKKYSGSSKIFSDKTELDSGEYIGDIHVNPIVSNGTSDLHARRNFAAVAIKGLWNLAYDCEQDEEWLNDVAAFHCVSDIIRPTFAQALGFPDDSITLCKDQREMKKRLRKFRQEELKDNADGNIGDIYEVWLSRNQLISTKEKLGELYNKI